MSGYHCDNPVLHSTLGLNCACYKKHRIMSHGSGDIPEYKQNGILEQSRFEGTHDPYQKEMIRTRSTRPNLLKMVQQQQDTVEFIPDWLGWSRHVWSSINFNGGKVGIFTLTVKYSDNISGYQIGDTFSNRQSKIVTQNNGLCITLPNKLKQEKLTSLKNGAFVSLEFDPPASAVQFAVMASTIEPNRKDAFRIFCDDKPIEKNEFYTGQAVNFAGNTFLAMKQTPDYIGASDTLIKLVRPEQIKCVRIEFSNLDGNPRGGRLVLTDILIK